MTAFAADDRYKTDDPDAPAVYMTTKITPVDALANALVDVIYGEMLCWDMSGGAYSFEERTKEFCNLFLPAMMQPYISESNHEN